LTSGMKSHKAIYRAKNATAAAPADAFEGRSLRIQTSDVTLSHQAVPEIGQATAPVSLAEHIR